MLWRIVYRALRLLKPSLLISLLGKKEGIAASLATLAGEVAADGKTALEMLGDYREGRYTRVPWWAVAALVFGILYFASPIDLVPDFIPILGQFDDLAVLLLCLKATRLELELYREWRSSLAPTEPSAEASA